MMMSSWLRMCTLWRRVDSLNNASSLKAGWLSTTRLRLTMFGWQMWSKEFGRVRSTPESLPWSNEKKSLLPRSRSWSHSSPIRWEFAGEKDSKDTDRVVAARWVLTWKKMDDLFNLDKASPTAARLGKLTLLSLAAVEGWQISCGDVRAAFLSGASFVRKLMVRLPKDCAPLLGIRSTEEVTMRMLKSAYGLADAPLLWFKEATRRLKKLKMIPQRLDQCTFGFYDSKMKKLKGMLILHVDDMLLAGDMKGEFGTMVEELKKNFDFGKWEILDKDHPITYCGGQLLQGQTGAVLSFENYIKKIAPLTIPEAPGDQEGTEQHRTHSMQRLAWSFAMARSARSSFTDGKHQHHCRRDSRRYRRGNAVSQQGFAICQGECQVWSAVSFSSKKAGRCGTSMLLRRSFWSEERPFITGRFYDCHDRQTSSTWRKVPLYTFGLEEFQASQGVQIVAGSRISGHGRSTWGALDDQNFPEDVAWQGRDVAKIARDIDNAVCGGDRLPCPVRPAEEGEHPDFKWQEGGNWIPCHKRPPEAGEWWAPMGFIGTSTCRSYDEDWNSTTAGWGDEVRLHSVGAWRELCRCQEENSSRSRKVKSSNNLEDRNDNVRFGGKWVSQRKWDNECGDRGHSMVFHSLHPGCGSVSTPRDSWVWNNDGQIEINKWCKHSDRGDKHSGARNMGQWELQRNSRERAPNERMGAWRDVWTAQRPGKGQWRLRATWEATGQSAGPDDIVCVTTIQCTKSYAFCRQRRNLVHEGWSLLALGSAVPYAFTKLYSSIDCCVPWMHSTYGAMRFLRNFFSFFTNVKCSQIT